MNPLPKLKVAGSNPVSRSSLIRVFDERPFDGYFGALF